MHPFQKIKNLSFFSIFLGYAAIANAQQPIDISKFAESLRDREFSESQKQHENSPRPKESQEGENFGEFRFLKDAGGPPALKKEERYFNEGPYRCYHGLGLSCMGPTVKDHFFCDSIDIASPWGIQLLVKDPKEPNGIGLRKKIIDKGDWVVLCENLDWVCENRKGKQRCWEPKEFYSMMDDGKIPGGYNINCGMCSERGRNFIKAYVPGDTLAEKARWMEYLWFSPLGKEARQQCSPRLESVWRGWPDSGPGSNSEIQIPSLK